MKKILLLTLMSFVGISGYAYDCVVDGIYYNLNKTDQTASVTSGSSINYSGAVHIPEKMVYNGITYSVTSIGKSAFSYCPLTEVTIPNSITSIGSHAFDGCSDLTELTIPNSVTSIESYAFRDCTSLVELTIPNSMTSIGGSAFENCTGLTKLTIPNSVTSIGNSAFWACGLRELTISDGTDVLNIDRSSFVSCPIKNLYLGRTIYFPYPTKKYVASPFYNITSLKTLTIGNSVTSIRDYTFYDCDSLTEVTIPNSVTTIGDNAFGDCTGLREITISDGTDVLNISFHSFCGGAIEKFYIGRDISSDGVSPFGNVYWGGLRELTIGNSVTRINISKAFEYCTSITSVTSLNMMPPTFYNNAFSTKTETNATLYVPAECMAIYQQADCWKNFYHIEEFTTDDIKSANTSKQGEMAIYTFDGMKVNTTNVSDLPSGIYIVNGKKYIVK